MKKIIAWLLLFAMSVGLVGCSNGELTLKNEYSKNMDAKDIDNIYMVMKETTFMMDKINKSDLKNEDDFDEIQNVVSDYSTSVVSKDDDVHEAYVNISYVENCLSLDFKNDLSDEQIREKYKELKSSWDGLKKYFNNSSKLSSLFTLEEDKYVEYYKLGRQYYK